jgi:hypothetical protein
VDSSSFHHKFVNKDKNVSRPPAARREWGDGVCRRERVVATMPSSERQQSTVRGDDHGAVERGPSQKLATVPKMYIFLAVGLRHRYREALA